MAEPRIKLPRLFGLRPEFILLGMALALLILAVSGFYYTQSVTARENTWMTLVKQMQSDVSEISKVGANSALGVPPDFATISALAENFDANVRALTAGDSDLGIKPLPASVSAEVNAATTSWQTMQKGIQQIVAAETSYARLQQQRAVIADAEAVLSPAYEALAERLGQRGAGSSQLYLAVNQLLRLKQIRAASEDLLKQRDSQPYLAALSKEVKTFSESNQSLTALDPGLGQAAPEFQKIVDAEAAITSDAPSLIPLQESVGSLKANGDALLQTLKGLEQSLVDNLVKRVLVPVMSYGAAALSILLLILFIALTVRTQRSLIAAAEARDAAQQRSILSLLDEITNIADGDLTGELTVTADFTGNIADSLNYTVQTLRGLVGTINDTSVEIAAAASSTTERVQQMSSSSEGQAREIVRATQAISSGSRSLEDVANRAEKLAEQAKISVDTAHSGAATVGRTIAGMATLREQIQDTAKRIKRLGESSQEIGNIIEFINDIAEQTNTLALNASIQAAMAGESGRGFAVVADEVQRLAERAASATKQIESLVKTIQADTQEAITSMERSTTNVVGGAKSAEEAGLALTRIEASSQELAKVIQDIAGASRAQSVETTKLASTMLGIREVSVQTSNTAQQTAESVSELSILSAKLRESVSGFKLPMDVTGL